MIVGFCSGDQLDEIGTRCVHAPAVVRTSADQPDGLFLRVGGSQNGQFDGIYGRDRQGDPTGGPFEIGSPCHAFFRGDDRNVLKVHLGVFVGFQVRSDTLSFLSFGHPIGLNIAVGAGDDHVHAVAGAKQPGHAVRGRHLEGDGPHSRWDQGGEVALLGHEGDAVTRRREGRGRLTAGIIFLFGPEDDPQFRRRVRTGDGGRFLRGDRQGGGPSLGLSAPFFPVEAYPEDLGIGKDLVGDPAPGMIGERGHGEKIDPVAGFQVPGTTGDTVHRHGNRPHAGPDPPAHGLYRWRGGRGRYYGGRRNRFGFRLVRVHIYAEGSQACQSQGEKQGDRRAGFSHLPYLFSETLI